MSSLNKVEIREIFHITDSPKKKRFITINENDKTISINKSDYLVFKNVSAKKGFLPPIILEVNPSRIAAIFIKNKLVKVLDSGFYTIHWNNKELKNGFRIGFIKKKFEIKAQINIESTKQEKMIAGHVFFSIKTEIVSGEAFFKNYMKLQFKNKNFELGEYISSLIGFHLEKFSDFEPNTIEEAETIITDKLSDSLNKQLSEWGIKTEIIDYHTVFTFFPRWKKFNLITYEDGVRKESEQKIEFDNEAAFHVLKGPLWEKLIFDSYWEKRENIDELLFESQFYEEGKILNPLPSKDITISALKKELAARFREKFDFEVKAKIKKPLLEKKPCHLVITLFPVNSKTALGPNQFIVVSLSSSELFFNNSTIKQYHWEKFSAEFNVLALKKKNLELSVTLYLIDGNEIYVLKTKKLQLELIDPFEEKN